MAIGTSGAALAQPYAVLGSDTLNGPIKAAINASGANLAYQNLGSGPAEQAILAGSQSIGPMSHNFRESTLIAHPTWTPAVKNVIGLDAVVVVVKNGQQRCKNLSLATDPNDPKSAQENNLLQLILGGVGGEGTIPACANPARLQAIVDFTNCFVGLDRVEHFYRPDDRSGTAEVIKQKLKIKRFCNGAAPGPTNLDAQDNDPLRYPCIPADDTRAVTVCSDLYGSPCMAGMEGCTQGLVVALSQADPNASDVTVSLSRRVKNDSASVAFAGRQAVKQPQSPTNGVNINTISYAPQNIRLDQYMLSRRLYLMKADPTSDPDRNLQEELFYDWATNPDNEVPGRCNMDPLMIQYGYVPCTDDCSPPTGANSLCVKTPFAPGAEPAGACKTGPCVEGDVCCGGEACPGWGWCDPALPRGEGYACSLESDCESPLSCLQRDWPVTTCALSPWIVSGTVTLSGNGLGGVTMNLNLPKMSYRWTTTDSSGDYELIGVANGTYTVQPSLQGYDFAPAETTVTVQDGSVTAVDFTASVVNFYRVSGTVTLSTGGGASDVFVFLAGATFEGTMTDSNGYFEFSAREGQYTLGVSDYRYSTDPPTRAVSVLGGDVTGQDFTATFIQMFNVSGVVTLNGAGLPNIGVMIRSSNGSLNMGNTGTSGDYSFQVSEGGYIVSPSYAPGYLFTPLERSVTVLGGDVSGQDFTAMVVATYTLSGHITKDGVGLAYIQVALMVGETMVTSTSTDSTGFYSILSNIGTYTVQPSSRDYVFTPAQAGVTVIDSDVTQDFTASSL
jgi:hypothetical protein